MTSTVVTTGVVGVVVMVTLPLVADAQPVNRVSVTVAVMASAGPSITRPVPSAGTPSASLRHPASLKAVSMVFETLSTSMPVVAAAGPSIVTLSNVTLLGVVEERRLRLLVAVQLDRAVT